MTLEEVLEDICDTAFHGHDVINVETRMSDSDGDQPLHVAVIQSNLDYVRILLANGADPKAKGDMDQTPLHYATYRGNKEMITMLLEAGASPLAVNEFGRTPVDNCQSSELRDLMLNWGDTDVASGHE